RGGMHPVPGLGVQRDQPLAQPPVIRARSVAASMSLSSFDARSRAIRTRLERSLAAPRQFGEALAGRRLGASIAMSVITPNRATRWRRSLERSSRRSEARIIAHLLSGEPRTAVLPDTAPAHLGIRSRPERVG